MKYFRLLEIFGKKIPRQPAGDFHFTPPLGLPASLLSLYAGQASRPEILVKKIPYQLAEDF